MTVLPIFLLLWVSLAASVQGYANYDITAPQNGRRYYVSKDHEAFNLATMNGRCRGLNGYLVQIDTRQEFDLVWSIADEVSGVGPFFTGITDEGSEGHFYTYNDKKPAGFLSWRWFQPDNWYGENCVEIWMTGLNDIACGKSGRYICEVPV
ncbi:collectin-11 [Plakobranchus ocellatus]|uniref:Collectin-11 n=1 Tax=Plakobranchus ocellatus TaxID=259542 RepID=A0AAV4D8J6_9GAST|nr:collectin-11 [Plakobranchus ocellatus]